MVRGGRTRKGSMQLSIEAIIILVIAIVLLGLGVAFIKNFFGEGEEALLGKFRPLKEECDVTASNPIIPKEFHVKKGEVNQENVCVYNNQNNDVANGRFEVLECIGPDGSAAPSSFVVNSLGQDIARGESTGYKTTIRTSENVSVGSTYICNIHVRGNFNTTVGPAQVTFTVS